MTDQIQENQQPEELEDDQMTLEEIAEQLDKFENDPPASAASVPFVVNELLPMMRAFVEVLLDHDEVIQEIDSGTFSPTPAGGAPGAHMGGLHMSPELFSQLVPMMQMVGFTGAVGHAIPLDVERQMMRYFTCVLVGMASNQTPEQVALQFKQQPQFANLDCSMPDMTPYIQQQPQG